METIKKYADYFDTTVSSIMFFAEDIEKDNTKPIKAAIRKKLIKFMRIIENATT